MTKVMTIIGSVGRIAGVGMGSIIKVILKVIGDGRWLEENSKQLLKMEI